MLTRTFFDSNLMDWFYGDRTTMPYVDISSDEETYLLEAELPGIKIEDVDIKVEGTTLSLKAKKIANKKKYLTAERVYGTFNRVFTLPSTIDSEMISATYQDGILSVIIPKKKDKPYRQIKINGSQ